MSSGFYIKKLVVSGNNRKDSVLDFDKGFNLVSGVSDTGKSYAFSCIDFMLGRTDNPKEIPEAKGCEDYYLQINTYDGSLFTIYRNITSTDVIIKECSYSDFFNIHEETKLQLNHSSTSENNLSVFLLKLCNMADKELKKKKTLKKKVSFRDFRKFLVVTEDRIITEKSPIYATGQYPDQPFYKSLFEYILSGNDNSGFVNTELDKDKKTHILGQIEFITKERNDINTEISGINAILELVDANINYSQQFEELNKEVESYLHDSERINKELQSLREEISLSENEKQFKIELIERFNLLIKHYQNDMSRLSFIVEGEELLNQLNTVPCPICQHDIFDSESIDIREEELNVALKAEYSILSKKIIDVEASINNLSIEIENINQSIEALVESREKLQIEKSKLEKKIIPIKEKISKIEENQSRQSRIEFLTDRIQYLFEKENELNKKIENTSSQTTSEESDEYSNITDFCTLLSELLQQIGYPGWKSITFDNSYRVYDFIISGKQRKSFGKGYRAISYSAILFTILEWILKNSIDFVPLLVLDSPLTTYHGKNALREKNDEAEQDIQDKFFTYLSKIPDDRQIIVFDNKIPPKSILKEINFTYFSGDTEGDRSGFIQD